MKNSSRRLPIRFDLALPAFLGVRADLARVPERFELRE